MSTDGRFSPFARLVALATDNPERPAIVTPDQLVTRAALADLVAARAGALLSTGLRPGQLTAVTLTDEIDHLVTTLALLSLATPNISLGSFESPDNRMRIARLLGVEQTVTKAGLSVERNARSAVSPGPLSGITVSAEDKIFYRSTSGTTGRPKTFAITMRLVLDMMQGLAVNPIKSSVLRTSSVEHDSSRIYQIGALLAGCTAAILGAFTADRLAPFCRRAGVTEIQTGTYRLASLLAAPEDPAHRLPDTLHILTGGSRVSADLRQAIRTRLTPNLWVNYATSEVGVISIAGPDDHDRWPEGVGQPCPGVQVSLCDPTGAEVPRGDIGELRISKPGITGWVRTGDLLSWPENGPLIFHSRSDDMMILNGINIFPGPIEDALAAHPAVLEAVAYAMPSQVHGQIPIAAVVLRDTACLTEADLLRHVRDLLGLRAPRQVKIVTSIPRTRLGKPRTATLRGNVN